jgi:hypothetical protein
MRIGDKIRITRSSISAYDYHFDHHTGDILTITDIHHPFYWAISDKHNYPTLLYRYEFEPLTTTAN